MAQCTKPQLRAQIDRMRAQFLQHPDLPIGSVLSDEWFKRLNAQSGDYRARVFTPVVTLEAFIRQVLSRDGSCQEAVAQVLAQRLEHELPACSVNTGPYCKARQRLPLTLLNESVRESGRQLHCQAPEAWRWHGYNVKLVDGTTVLMPDTDANQREFPQMRGQQPGVGFPIARLVGVMSLSSGAVVDYALGPYRGKGSGELSLLSEILDTFTPGDVMLGDSYYCTYALVAYQRAREIPVVFQNHAKRKVDFRRGQRLGPKDHIVEWVKPPRCPPWLTPGQYRALPQRVQVRELEVKGKVLVTTLLDAKRFSTQAIAKLYGLRWSAELDLRTLKADLNMGKLRCQTPQMVRKEIAVHFLAYNLIRAAMAQAARAHDLAPRQLSFKVTVQLLEAMKAQLCSLSEQAFKALLKAITTTRIGQRKRHTQPRAVKQRPKPYPRLTIPRAVACQRLVSNFA